MWGGCDWLLCRGQGAVDIDYVELCWPRAAHPHNHFGFLVCFVIDCCIYWFPFDVAVWFVYVPLLADCIYKRVVPDHLLLLWVAGDLPARLWVQFVISFTGYQEGRGGTEPTGMMVSPACNTTATALGEGTLFLSFDCCLFVFDSISTVVTCVFII